MSTNITSTNPVVQAIVGGTAPPAARLAAARGLLPIPQADLLEVLVALRDGEDQELASAAESTLATQESSSLVAVAEAVETAPSVLGYLASNIAAGRAVHEALLGNPKTPDQSIVLLAAGSPDGDVLELISLNQQRLIRVPEIIDAVLSNPARTPEAERRVKETRREFFEKERGAQQVADEMRAQGKAAAAEFFEAAESVPGTEHFTVEDAWAIAQHIEVSDDDIDDSWLSSDLIEQFFDEPYEQRIVNMERIITDARLEAGELAPERISLIRRILLMSVKDRVRLAQKGDREARGILVRDSNKIVSAAVIRNPRITDNEIEGISAMRTVSEEVLRLISLNRAWARSYSIIHNLARNPRTSIGTAIGILPRIRQKELMAISQNKNVSEAVRRQATRLVQARTGK
jgi:hypothetical protein